MAKEQKGVSVASPDASGVNPLTVDLTVDKVWVFELVQKTQSRGKLLVDGRVTDDDDSPYPPYLSLPNPVQVYDPEKKITRWARLIEGYPTFWQDEQKDIPPYAQNNPWIPAFKDGFLYLKTPQDSLKVRFMLLHDYYQDNPRRVSGKPPKFKLVSKEKENKNSLDYFSLLKDAMNKAHDAPDEVMLPHAKFLNIRFTDRHNVTREPKDIRVDYIRKAQADPKLFLSSYDNPVNRVYYMITKAIDDGTITLGHVKGQAHWSKTKALIATLDADGDPVKQLAEFGLTEKGKEFYDRLSKESL